MRNLYIHLITWSVLLLQAGTIWGITAMFKATFGPTLTGAPLWFCFLMIFVLAWSMGQIVYAYVRLVRARRAWRKAGRL